LLVASASTVILGYDSRETVYNGSDEVDNGGDEDD
jgi:hypothetical protein